MFDNRDKIIRYGLKYMSMGEYLVFVLFIIVNVGLVFENVSYILDIIDVICCFLLCWCLICL